MELGEIRRAAIANVTQRYPQVLLVAALHVCAFQFNRRKALKVRLRGGEGGTDFTVGIRTEDDAVGAGLRFENGRVRALAKLAEKPDVALVYADTEALFEMLGSSPTEVLKGLMGSRFRTEGNFTYLTLFNYYSSLLFDKLQHRQEETRRERDAQTKRAYASAGGQRVAKSPSANGATALRMSAPAVDHGVRFLEDPYLPNISLDDFPRLQSFLDIHFTERPALCHERPAILTRWFKKHGFETNAAGKPWDPRLRQGCAFNHLMKTKAPIIRKGDLLAGTSTAREVGVLLYPDAHGTLIWGELHSAPDRELNPYQVSQETAETLHNEVFPYWAKRNFREWVRDEYDNPLGQQIDERFAVYFVWKSVGLSHTIPDYPKLLSQGTQGILGELGKAIEEAGDDSDKANALSAMVLCLEGINAYSRNLAREAEREARAASDATRRAELERMAEICRRVPEHPAETFDEAVQAIWTLWVALHNENTNTGMSLGRLDLWLQPYFKADLEKCETESEREAAVHRAIELVGCLFMRCTDHAPLIPDIGNYLYGGAPSSQAITLGGVTPDGEDAVCDMTYIFLKVTELLGIQDPNVNARFHPEANSDAYLKRLCEVNLITRATPSMHSDHAMMAALRASDYPESDVRNWSATGCVEPTVSTKHMAHTGSILMNLVAALEMALFDGRHPLMNWDVGPKTGEAFGSFDEFLDAFKAQFRFLIGNAVEYDNALGRAHSTLRPSPLLSSVMDGCIESGADAVDGGARYNSAGVALIGLADVTDSLMAIKQLVFDEKRLSLAEFKDVLADNFEGRPDLLALVKNRVPLFGSGSQDALDMAGRVTRFTNETCAGHRTPRGGHYTTGFWSMSNHVAFGTLAGALPSGRLAGKPFTPGLTPQPCASTNLLDNLRDVAGLDPKHMNNNMAFNVKVVPNATDPHESVVDRMFAYVKAYFGLGGMQVQMNVVDANTLRDAMLHPDEYRNLLVRISGYSAYFVNLNIEMQRELIERCEYGLV